MGKKKKAARRRHRSESHSKTAEAESAPEGPLSFGLGIRVSVELKERIDAFAKKLRGERRGARVSRGEAARILIEMGLEADE